ncbi:hypothetical protein EV426DRAFT_710248 [Tirmania nivea]|nr:hypothetical protein EV426DRAFT_710248 [Tirmania nivea]
MPPPTSDAAPILPVRTQTLRDLGPKSQNTMGQPYEADPKAREEQGSLDPISTMGSMSRLTDQLEIKAHYDLAIRSCQTADLPEFYENFSTMLVETEESVCALAAEYQAHLDGLTVEDYQQMGVEKSILMKRVQYQHIVELKRAWGDDWQSELEGLLPREPKEDCLYRLARFAYGPGKMLTEEALRDGFREIIKNRQDCPHISKASDIQTIDITKFEQRLARSLTRTILSISKEVAPLNPSSLGGVPRGAPNGLANNTIILSRKPLGKRRNPSPSLSRRNVKRRAIIQPPPTKIFIDLTNNDNPNMPSDIAIYFEKLKEDARNGDEPDAVEDAQVASDMIKTLLGNGGFNMEDPVD